MPFDKITCKLLAHYTAYRPHSVDDWYGPWNTILTTLFTPIEGYVVTPQRRNYIENGVRVHFFDLIMQVTRVEEPNFTPRTVLILELKQSPNWRHGIDRLFRQLDRLVFADSARDKMYWIAAIGPHWVYGMKDGLDGSSSGLTPLIEWHDTTHDDSSFADLQTLAALVHAI